jgi:hypothetical protein
VDPETRRIVPDAKGRTKIKLVYVVLESQYQSSLAAAVKNINAKNEKVQRRENYGSCWGSCRGRREGCMGGRVVLLWGKGVAAARHWQGTAKGGWGRGLCCWDGGEARA